MKNVAIFASGSGSNAENIIEYFKNDDRVTIAVILSNSKDAYVLQRAKKFGVPAYVFNRDDFYNGQLVLDKLMEYHTDLVVLAGFMWLVPGNILRAFSGKIINIHPALLPKYGGKGMYGMFVHEAVKQSGDTVSGISIHYVNEKYDEGEIIFQAKCNIDKKDTPESIAQKIHALEYEHFPAIIEQVLLQ